MRDGALMAIDEANAKAHGQGLQVRGLVLDDATATAGQYDPAQAATNARKFVSDKDGGGCDRPADERRRQGDGAHPEPGNLAIITPSSTNPDITDPKFAAQYRPAGKAIYFRTVTTDAFQGPNMADFMAEKLKVKAIYILDDQGAYGVGLADAFQKRIADKGRQGARPRPARPQGRRLLGHPDQDQVAERRQPVLRRRRQAGVKLVKQSYEIVPDIKKAGGDGMYGADLLKGAGFPAVEGWYATIAAPHCRTTRSSRPGSGAFRQKFTMRPEDYTITAYDAAESSSRRSKSRRDGQAGDPRLRARRHPGRQGRHAAGRGAFDANGDLTARSSASSRSPRTTRSRSTTSARSTSISAWLRRA